MSSENSNTSDPHRLTFILSNKMNLNSSDKYVSLSNLTIYYTLETIQIKKSQIKILNVKYQLQRGMINLNYLIDHILLEIFKITLNIFSEIIKC